MKYKVREMIKNVIEENAVSFKETTSQVLLNKVGNVLSEKYVEISQQIFTEEAGLFVSNTGKDMGPVNPPTHGGGYTENPNRPNRRPDSTGDSERPTESIPTYNPQDPWWNTNDGRIWQVYFNYWQQNNQNPNAWRPNTTLPQFASANDLIRYLANNAEKAGVVPPWVYSPPNG